MSGRNGILIIGDVMTDIIVTPTGSLVYGADCMAQIRRHPGGSGSNLAAWLATLRGDVHFAGIVGVEEAGLYAAHFARSGVIAHLAASFTRPTGQIIVLIHPDTAERSFLTDRGANDELCEAHLPLSLLDGMGHLHVSAYALFGEGPRRAVRRLMQEAKARGLSLSVDPSSSSCLEQAGPAAFYDWTAGVDIIAPNVQEAAAITHEWDAEAQLQALEQHYPLVLLKQGAYGASLRHGGETTHYPAEAVDCVNTAGAGDAFLAGFLCARFAGQSLHDALRQAVTSGTRAVREQGAQPSGAKV